jgi:hypothetical protein
LKTFIDLDIVVNMIMVSFVNDRMLTNLVAICPGLVLFYCYWLVCTDFWKARYILFLFVSHKPEPIFSSVSVVVLFLSCQVWSEADK